MKQFYIVWCEKNHKYVAVSSVWMFNFVKWDKNHWGILNLWKVKLYLMNVGSFVAVSYTVHNDVYFLPISSYVIQNLTRLRIFVF